MQRRGGARPPRASCWLRRSTYARRRLAASTPRSEWSGANDSIEIEAFDDPKIEGVTCHLSRAVTGGVGKLIGTSVDTSDASIACRQIGPIRITEPLEDGERVFSERRSIVFKTLQVVRFCDRKRNTLVYLVYSTKVVEGSPKNSISTVPMMPWRTDGGERIATECGDGEQE